MHFPIHVYGEVGIPWLVAEILSQKAAEAVACVVVTVVVDRTVVVVRKTN